MRGLKLRFLAALGVLSLLASAPLRAEVFDVRRVIWGVVLGAPLGSLGGAAVEVGV